MHNATNETLFAKITIKVIVNPSARIIDHATAYVMKKLIKELFAQDFQSSCLLTFGWILNFFKKASCTMHMYRNILMKKE